MTEFAKLKPGNKLSEAQYYTVVKFGKKDGKDAVLLISDFNGGNVVLDKEYIENYIITAEQYTEEKKIGKIEAAETFIKSTGIALTVNFNTQIKEKDAKEQLYELYANKGGKMLSEADYKKKVNDIVSSVITGKERTMIGRHYGTLTELGRVQFIDMEEVKDETKPYDNRYRQVDPRTINWMIIKGVKYIVK